jgi:anhydro-N-acetylmuramic acid kinase
VSTQSYFSFGLMSGSSLDGLDICYSRIDVNNGQYSYEILDSDTIVYQYNLLDKIKHCRSLSSLELLELDVELGQWYAEQILKFYKRIAQDKLPPKLFIASHGHTVYHYPERFISLQIGNGQILATKTGFQCITNLRFKDITYGGSGAPIVPIGDLLLFSNYTYCLNLGGIMNISVKDDDSIIAYDIGACNQLINHYAQQLGHEYDRDGELARQGNFSEELLNQLNAVDYFHKLFPKSLDNGFSKILIDICDKFDISVYDKLNTFYHHVGFQISSSIEVGLNPPQLKKILSTGGGTHNKYLIELMREKYKLNIHIPDDNLINYKEALVMSLIGVRLMENKYNVLASVTGASKNTICGDLFNP